MWPALLVDFRFASVVLFLLSSWPPKCVLLIAWFAVFGLLSMSPIDLLSWCHTWVRSGLSPLVHRTLGCAILLLSVVGVFFLLLNPFALLCSPDTQITQLVTDLTKAQQDITQLHNDVNPIKADITGKQTFELIVPESTSVLAVLTIGKLAARLVLSSAALDLRVSFVKANCSIGCRATV